MCIDISKCEKSWNITDIITMISINFVGKLPIQEVVVHTL